MRRNCILVDNIGIPEISWLSIEMLRCSFTLLLFFNPLTTHIQRHIPLNLDYDAGFWTTCIATLTLSVMLERTDGVGTNNLWRLCVVRVPPVDDNILNGVCGLTCVYD